MDDDDSTASPSKKGVWRSCYLDYRHNECLKDGVLTGAGFVVLLGCLVFAMSAIFAPKVRHTRLVLFTLAGTASIWTTTSILLTRTIFCVHYGLDSRAWLLVTIQWFKIQQYTLPFGIFLAYTAKSAGYTDWPSSLIWPCHLLFAALTAGVVVYTAVTEDTYQQVCAAPGWMVLSSFGLGQAGLYCLVSAYVVSKVRRRFIPPVWQSCRRLFIWGCICLLAPIAQIVHDSYLASDDNCAGQELPTVEWLALSISGSILESLIPIVTAMVISAKEDHHRAEKQPLLSNS
eukprot:m.120859 g.120859  ORF g.120859 m.120859 type:complete len:288 (-) comp15621_c0_seq22:92-955(-)